MSSTLPNRCIMRASSAAGSSSAAVEGAVPASASSCLRELLPSPAVAGSSTGMFSLPASALMPGAAPGSSKSRGAETYSISTPSICDMLVWQVEFMQHDDVDQ